MEVVGSEIGQKMRSAIKAKLTELGCYVDDELPDYVMVMVANKRTRSQMEGDLQLFLGDNTVLFVSWLHQVLKKLEEVTITAPPKSVDAPETTKSLKSADKDKVKKTTTKKTKVKEKDKHKSVDNVKKSKKKQHKKGDKKSRKQKKKSKEPEIIRPNIPPLLMNIEKESEPSITDVFAGQILKNHGISIDIPKEEPTTVDIKPDLELKRSIIPVIDPASISSPTTSRPAGTEEGLTNGGSNAAPKSEQLNEITQIEVKIQGLRQKLAEQLDCLSEDDDMLTIRTEAEELMSDFVADVFQEIKSARPPNLKSPVEDIVRTPSPPPTATTSGVAADVPVEVESLPVIELNLPKRSVRERLGARLRDDHQPETENSNPSEELGENSSSSSNVQVVITKITKTLDKRSPAKFSERKGSSSSSKDSDSVKSESSSSSSSSSDSNNKKPSVASSSCAVRARAAPASVVSVRPRPRPAAAAVSKLLLRAMADAQKSLINLKAETLPEKEKRPATTSALLRRTKASNQNIVIQVPVDRPRSEANDNQTAHVHDDVKGSDEEMEYVPRPMSLTVPNAKYVPSRRDSENGQHDAIENLNIHNTSDRTTGPTFVVTLHGLDPNVFLTKKLKSEGLLDDNGEIKDPPEDEKPKVITIKPPTNTPPLPPPPPTVVVESNSSSADKKRLSDTSEDSDTQVIIKNVVVPEPACPRTDKRKSNLEIKVAEVAETKPCEKTEKVPARKRKASPIVFESSSAARRRTSSAGSDSHTVITTASAHKFDSVPSCLPTSGSAVRMPAAERSCRAFPQCRFGASCAFTHPPCKFANSCTRRGCAYSHPTAAPMVAPNTPYIASHVVPAANYKSITAISVPPMCKYYPHCANPVCHFYHPKPCRYGKACANKSDCNFFHIDTPSSLKWRAN